MEFVEDMDLVAQVKAHKNNSKDCVLDSCGHFRLEFTLLFSSCFFST